MSLAPFFEHDLPVFDPPQPPCKRRLPIEWLGRHDLCQPSGESPVIRFVAERAIQPGRRHFERVLLRKRRLAELFLLDIQDRTEILADALSVFDPDSVFRRLDHPAVGTVDDDPQHVADRFPAQLHVEDLEPVTPGNALGGVANPPDPLVVSGHARLKKGP